MCTILLEIIDSHPVYVPGYYGPRWSWSARVGSMSQAPSIHSTAFLILWSSALIHRCCMGICIANSYKKVILSSALGKLIALAVATLHVKCCYYIFRVSHVDLHSRACCISIICGCACFRLQDVPVTKNAHMLTPRNMHKYKAASCLLFSLQSWTPLVLQITPP